MLQQRTQVPQPPRPLLCLDLHSAQAGSDRRQPFLEFQPRGGQWWPAVIGQGGSHRHAVVTHDLRFLARLLRRLPFNRPDAADALFQLFFRMPIGFVDRFSRFTQVMEMAQLIGHPGQGSCHRLADRVLAIGDDSADGHRQSRRTSVNNALRSSIVAERRLWATSTSPERQSRTTHNTSWPMSGWSPSMANTTRRCLDKRECSRSRSAVAKVRSSS